MSAPCGALFLTPVMIMVPAPLPGPSVGKECPACPWSASAPSSVLLNRLEPWVILWVEGFTLWGEALRHGWTWSYCNIISFVFQWLEFWIKIWFLHWNKYVIYLFNCFQMHVEVQNKVHENAKEFSTSCYSCVLILHNIIITWWLYEKFPLKNKFSCSQYFFYM